MLTCIIQVQRNHVPLNLIHVFSRKLYIKEYAIVKEGNGTQLDSNDECENLKKYFSTLDIFAQKMIMKKCMNIHIHVQLLCVRYP